MQADYCALVQTLDAAGLVGRVPERREARPTELQAAIINYLAHAGLRGVHGLWLADTRTDLVTWLCVRPLWHRRHRGGRRRQGGHRGAPCAGGHPHQELAASRELVMV